jgi:hypothetical protein
MAAAALTDEERALVLELSDRLIALYGDRDAARLGGEADRAAHIETRISEARAERQALIERANRA